LVTCKDKFGFLGFYIVKAEYRGRGFGIRTWEKSLEYLRESRNIGLDSVIARQRDYEKYDFKFAYRNLRYAGSSSIIRTSTKPLKNIHNRFQRR
jgi:hypothetical protein